MLFSEFKNNGESLAFLIFRLSVIFVGILGNIIFLAFLKNNRIGFPVSTIILRHQAVTDCFVCLLTILLHVQSSGVWLTGSIWFDRLICRLWHTHVIYWIFVTVGIYAIALTAVDRFLAFSRPLIHHRSKSGLFYVALVGSGGLAVLFQVPYIFGATYREPRGKTSATCTLLAHHSNKTEFWTRFFVTYTSVWIFFNYLVPLAVVAGLYGYIIVLLRTSLTPYCPNSKRTRRSASNKLTKASVCIGVAFVVFFTIETICYFLSIYRKDDFSWSSWITTLSLFVVSANSCVNPLIYGILIEPFQNFLRHNFCCCLWLSTDVSFLNAKVMSSVAMNSK